MKIAYVFIVCISPSLECKLREGRDWIFLAFLYYSGSCPGLSAWHLVSSHQHTLNKQLCLFSPGVNYGPCIKDCYFQFLSLLIYLMFVMLFRIMFLFGMLTDSEC